MGPPHIKMDFVVGSTYQCPGKALIRKSYKIRLVQGRS